MTVISSPPEDRPLITFALFAFNQEKYIREAIEGAFAQTYEPLEIILSDDNSSDRTFEIMQEMTVAYKGPHKIILRKQEVNDGLLNHVCAVISDMTGEIIVMAAGDDISSDDRVSEVAAAWTPNCLGLFTACDLIDENGKIVEKNWLPAGNARTRLPWLKKNNCDLFIYGASSSYHRSIAQKLPKSTFKVNSEDTPLNLITQLSSGEVLFKPKALVKYRFHGETISSSNIITIENIKSFAGIKHGEKEHEKRISDRKSTLLYLNNILVPSLGFVEHVQLNDIQSDIDFCDLRIRWYSWSFLQRTKAFFNSKGREKRWILPRILGLNFYAILKYTSFRILGTGNKYKKGKN